MFVATQPQRIFLLPGKEVSNVVTFCGQLPKEKKSDNESLKNNFCSALYRCASPSPILHLFLSLFCGWY